MHGTFYEFFAGGGMARAGLGAMWTCLFSNDIDEKKALSYITNWGSANLKTDDIANLQTSDLPGAADLAWASFPCQDLSLAGSGAGLKGARSGTFWPFWDLIKQLHTEGRAPNQIVLENVCGTLTSHDGKDFRSIVKALTNQGYKVGALVIDAVLFVPQSRPRLFFLAVKGDRQIPSQLRSETPDLLWASRALLRAYDSLSETQKANWVWWTMPRPAMRTQKLSDLIEENPAGVRWHTTAETEKLLEMMSPINRKKVEQARQLDRRVVGTVYKRTRVGLEGNRVQRAEARFDEISGCLRTPAGGSSRQIILAVGKDRIRSRLLSSREAARLMGLPDSYILPDNYNDAYHVIGDGLATPVVSWMEKHLLHPLLEQASPKTRLYKSRRTNYDLVHA